MKEHNISLIPINAMYREAANGMMTGDYLRYSMLADKRAIYFRDPLESWFRCKAVTESPYLEVPMYDLLPGDIIIVTFEMLKTTNQGPMYFGCNYSAIKGNITDTLDSVYIDEKMIDTYFKEFEIPFVVPDTQANVDGLLLTIRSYNANHVETEFIIKNININIKTNNNKFKCNDNYEIYETSKDYYKSIFHASASKIATNFKTVIPIFKQSGQITISNNSIRFNTSGTAGNWKGLLAYLSSCKYNSPYICYVDYKYSPGASIGIYNQPIYNDDTYKSSEEREFPYKLPEMSSSFSKAIIVQDGKYLDNRRISSINIGRTGVDINIEINRIIFAHPRYDAQRYFAPNDHFELFKDFNFLGVSSVMEFEQETEGTILG